MSHEYSPSDSSFKDKEKVSRRGVLGAFGVGIAALGLAACGRSEQKPAEIPGGEAVQTSEPEPAPTTPEVTPTPTPEKGINASEIHSEADLIEAYLGNEEVFRAMKESLIIPGDTPEEDLPAVMTERLSYLAEWLTNPETVVAHNIWKERFRPEPEEKKSVMSRSSDTFFGEHVAKSYIGPEVLSGGLVPEGDNRAIGTLRNWVETVITSQTTAQLQRNPDGKTLAEKYTYRDEPDETKLLNAPVVSIVSSERKTHTSEPVFTVMLGVESNVNDIEFEGEGAIDPLFAVHHLEQVTDEATEATFGFTKDPETGHWVLTTLNWHTIDNQ